MKLPNTLLLRGQVSGWIKWFDAKKGLGMISSDGNGDVLVVGGDWIENEHVVFEVEVKTESGRGYATNVYRP